MTLPPPRLPEHVGALLHLRPAIDEPDPTHDTLTPHGGPELPAPTPLLTDVTQYWGLPDGLVQSPKLCLATKSLAPWALLKTTNTFT